MRYSLTLKKEKNVTDNDPDSYGDVYMLTVSLTQRVSGSCDEIATQLRQIPGYS